MRKILHNLIDRIKSNNTYINQTIGVNRKKTVAFSLLITFMVDVIILGFSVNVILFSSWVALIILLVASLGSAWFFLLVYGGIARGYNEEFNLKYKNSLYITFGILSSIVLTILALLLFLLAVL
jgi:hypothetical protein